MAMCRTQPNSDLVWMKRALALAKAARGHVWPNPPVGCVLIKDGAVLAEAATHPPGGRPHAERAALEQAATKSGGQHRRRDPLRDVGTLLSLGQYPALHGCDHCVRCAPCRLCHSRSRSTGERRRFRTASKRRNRSLGRALRVAGNSGDVRLLPSRPNRPTRAAGSGAKDQDHPRSRRRVIVNDRRRPFIALQDATGVKTTLIRPDTASGLLVGLADIGLTTVAVSARDPDAKELRPITNTRADRGAA